MQYREFKKLGVKVSAFGLGCMRFPMIGEESNRHIDQELATSIIRTVIDGGVNYVDTAYVYSDGTNERAVGQALRDGYREKVFLATKLPTLACDTPEDLPRLFEEQCRNLETDHIDFYLVHSLDRTKWDKVRALGVREFLTKLKAEGRIRFACFSFHDNLDAFSYILNDYDWDMCQLQYNFMDIDHQAGRRGVELAGEKGIPVVIMEGLLGGKLANAPENVQALYDAYPVHRSPAEWGFRWLCNHKQVLTVLSGVTDLVQAKDNLRIFDEATVGCMSREDLELMDRVRDAYLSRTRVGCTGCRYCMPCPGGVDIPRVFSLWNSAFQYGRTLCGDMGYARLAKEGNGADKCLSCGKCERVCPQQLPIRQLMKEAQNEAKVK